MVEIGRKIYYELSTGNVILDIEDREGYVLESTIDQDFQMYTALQPYQKNGVGLLQLDYGQDKQNFLQYPYHIDITQNPPVIVWDTANLIGASLSDVQASKIAQLNDMYQQTLYNGFTANVGGTDHTFGWTTDDKANILVTQQGINDGLITFPLNYADFHGNSVTLNSQADLDLIKSTAASFFNAQHQQILNLIGQVKSQTTNANGEVDAIQWTPATY